MSNEWMSKWMGKTYMKMKYGRTNESNKVYQIT